MLIDPFGQDMEGPAIEGFYTKEEADQWIREYEEAVQQAAA